MARILIEVKGGCVEAIYADQPVEVKIVDHDRLEEEDKKFPWRPEVNPKYIEENWD